MKKLIIIPLIFLSSIIFGQTKTDTLLYKGDIVSLTTGESLNDLIAKFNAMIAIDSLRPGTDTLFIPTHWNAEILLTSNSTCFLSGITNGVSGNIDVLQDGTGAWTFVFTNPHKIINDMGTYISEGANELSVVSYWMANDTLRVTYGPNYK